MDAERMQLEVMAEAWHSLLAHRDPFSGLVRAPQAPAAFDAMYQESGALRRLSCRKKRTLLS